jgi:hypothetical protein
VVCPDEGWDTRVILRKGELISSCDGRRCDDPRGDGPRRVERSGVGKSDGPCLV